MKCAYTTKASEFAYAHAVLLSGKHLSPMLLPSIRLLRQKWIFHSDVAPPAVWDAVNLNAFRQVFNITATYMPDTDLRLGSHKFGCRRKRGWQAPDGDLSGDKVGQAVMIADRCMTHSKREAYVEELRRHNISVDILGACGNVECDDALRIQDKVACIEDILNKRYRFLLVFEESLCQGYISESLLATWGLNIIPVVLGFADYANHLPLGSYIDIRDFSTVSRLAVLLNSITDSPQKYNNYIYIKWSHDCRMASYQDFPCRLCQYLHENRRRSQILPHVGSYFGMRERCQAPSTFYQGVADTLIDTPIKKLQLDGIHNKLVAKTRQRPVEVVTMTGVDYEPPRPVGKDHRSILLSHGYGETNLIVERSPNGSFIRAQPEKVADQALRNNQQDVDSVIYNIQKKKKKHVFS